MPDAGKSLQFVNVVFSEKGGYKSHGFSDSYFFSVGDGDASAFLASVLQGVKSHGNIAGDVFAIVNADNAAFFVKFFQHGILLDDGTNLKKTPVFKKKMGEGISTGIYGSAWISENSEHFCKECESHWKLAPKRPSARGFIRLAFQRSCLRLLPGKFL